MAAMNSLLTSRLYNQSTFYQAFEKDLMGAQHSVIVESPFITAMRIDKILPIFSKLRKRGVHITVNTRSPEEHDKVLALQAARGVAMMQSIGVTVLYTGRLHRKLAIIDSEILWEGSLNILSQSDSCEIMRRTESIKVVSQMTRFLGVSKYIG